MALTLIGSIAAITDAVAANLVSGPTQTRAAVDARVRGIVPAEVSSQIANSTTLQAALAAMIGNLGDANLAAEYARTITPTADWNTLTQRGVWRRASATPNGSNVPPTQASGTLYVTKSNEQTDQAGGQLFMAADGIWYRSVSDAGVWSEWRALDSDYRGLMPDGQSIDDMTGQQWTGQWYVPSTAAADALVGAKPPMSGPGTFTVVSSRTSGYSHTVQWWSMHLLSGSKLFMRLTVASGAFNDWIEVGGAGSSAGARDLRLQLFEEAYPLVSTGNKGVVVLRYDHGLTNFKSTILPLHQQYNLPAYIAMNSRNWSLDENSGATQEEARSWANVEWGNHSADHEDKSGGAAIYDNIVNGRIELEAQLERTIHGYTAPGLTGGQFDGFNTGWVDGYSNTPAGAMILDHHAIASGGIGDTNFRPLDGKIRIGGRHYTWEQRTYAQIKAEIDTAISTKTALTIMAHPRTMNQSGYWTPALLEQVLAYIRSQIDAGNLADLTYYQSQHAVLRTPVEAFQAALA